MARYGLLGERLGHSFSPYIHRALGGYDYELIEVSREELGPFLRARDFSALNVTIPYKQAVMPYLDSISDTAERIGSVNTIVQDANGGLHGYNTDVDGVVGAVRETGFQPSDTLIIGAGGAAMAAVVGAKILGSGTITIANRTYEKAAALAAAHSCDAVPLDAIGTLTPDLVIYTIPGGAPIVPGMPLGGAVVLEAEYKRPSLSEAPCRQYISGLRWILHQAVAGYSLFTGEAPNLEALSRSIIC